MHQRIVTGFSVTVIILVIMGWFSYSSILEFKSTADLVSQSHYLANLRGDLLSSLVSAESEARGFVIMGREDYLTLYNDSIDSVNAATSQLRKLRPPTVSGDLIEKLVELIELRMERLKLTVHVRQAEGIDAAVGVAGIGKTIMDEVRSVALQIDAIQDKELSAAASRLTAVSKRATLIIGIGSLLAVIFHLTSTIALRGAVLQREKLERALIEVSEREQRRIGQDLHDGLCQQLTGISLMANSLHRFIAPNQVPQLTNIVGLINNCIEETRLVTRGLHPVPDEPTGLTTALRELIYGVDSQTDVVCTLELNQAIHLTDQSVSSNIFRIAQESIRNAIKHAGASTILVNLRVHHGQLHLKIADDGKGITPARSSDGLGLRIMKYRASTIGGRLLVNSNHPSGTVVQLFMPYPDHRGAPQIDNQAENLVESANL